MNLVNKLKKRKMDNKGFSLVELIIVIAIMAILVGIVGTQVLPYLNKSRESKDLQLVNSYSTAATTAYSSNAEKVTLALTVDTDGDGVADAPGSTLTVNVYGTNSDASAILLADEIQKLVDYTLPELKNKMSSDKGKKVSDIIVVYDFDNHTITTSAGGTTLDTVHADF